MNDNVEIYTDGSCLGNPGNGGWAALLRKNGVEKMLSGKEESTTNNRMELRACIEGLKALTKQCKVVLYTDSKYVQKGMTEWIDQWVKHNWRTKDKKLVKNMELWQELDEIAACHEVEWVWVRGHNGNKYNEMVDTEARFRAI